MCQARQDESSGPTRPLIGGRNRARPSFARSGCFNYWHVSLGRGLHSLPIQYFIHWAKSVVRDLSARLIKELFATQSTTVPAPPLRSYIGCAGPPIDQRCCNEDHIIGMAPDLNSISHLPRTSTMSAPTAAPQAAASEELPQSRRTSTQMPPPPPPRTDSLYSSPQMDNTGVGIGPGKYCSHSCILTMLT